MKKKKKTKDKCSNILKHYKFNGFKAKIKFKWIVHKIYFNLNKYNKNIQIKLSLNHFICFPSRDI